MNRTFAMLTLAIPLMALPRLDAAAESAAPESARSFLLRMQEEAAAPIIQYCNASVPEQKAFLDAEYASFKGRFRAANMAMIEEGIDSTELSKPVDPALVANLARVQEQMLAQVKKLDPKVFCAQLRSNLASQTVETIGAALATALRQYIRQEEAKAP